MATPPREIASSLVQLASTTQVVDLGQELFSGMPVHESHPPFLYTPYQRHGDWTLEGDYWGTNELIISTGHTGTHVDALCHIAYKGQFFDGSFAKESLNGVDGFSHLGAETIQPMVCRGIYVDVASLEGVDLLPRGFAISDQTIQRALSRAGLQLNTGDAVLLRTGFGSLWNEGSAYLSSSGGNPGIDLSAAKFLEEFRPTAVGSDTTVVEHCPADAPTLPVHSFLLAQRGIHLIENMNFEDMPRIEACEFLFICAPLKVRGSSGGQVRPLAMLGRRT